MVIVQQLGGKLPDGYVAGPRVHLADVDEYEVVAVGVMQTGFPLLLLGLSAISWLSGGIAGLVSMRPLPKYKHLLKRKQGRGPNRTDNREAAQPE